MKRLSVVWLVGLVGCPSLASHDPGVVPPSSPTTSGPNSGATVEDGRVVVTGRSPLFCFIDEEDNKTGLCDFTEAGCEKIRSGFDPRLVVSPCTQKLNAAGFTV